MTKTAAQQIAELVRLVTETAVCKRCKEEYTLWTVSEAKLSMSRRNDSYCSWACLSCRTVQTNR